MEYFHALISPEESILDLDKMNLQSLPEELRKRYEGPPLVRKIEERMIADRRKMKHARTRMDTPKGGGLYDASKYIGLSREERKLQQQIELIQQMEEKEEKKKGKKDIVHPKPVKRIKVSETPGGDESVASGLESSNTQSEGNPRFPPKSKQHFPASLNTHLNQKHPLGGFDDVGEYIERYQNIQLEALEPFAMKAKQNPMERKILEMEKSLTMDPPKSMDSFSKSISSLCNAMNGLDLAQDLDAIYSLLER